MIYSKLFNFYDASDDGEIIYIFVGICSVSMTVKGVRTQLSNFLKGTIVDATKTAVLYVKVYNFFWQYNIPFYDLVYISYFATNDFS